MLNCPHDEGTKNSQLSLKLIIKQIQPLNKTWQRASMLWNSYDKCSVSYHQQDVWVGVYSTSSRCIHNIKVFFQATKNFPIFTSSEGFNRISSEIDSSAWVARTFMEAGEFWIKSKELSPHCSTLLWNPLRQEKFNYQTISWPPKTDWVNEYSSCQLNHLHSPASSCPLCHLRHLQVLQFHLNSSVDELYSTISLGQE